MIIERDMLLTCCAYVQAQLNGTDINSMISAKQLNG